MLWHSTDTVFMYWLIIFYIYIPDSIESVVVFPAPFVPKNPKHSPAWTEKVNDCTATFEPWCIPPGYTWNWYNTIMEWGGVGLTKLDLKNK
jgi:hypothetical protein